MVEHTTENRGVGGSIPPLTTAPTLVLLCAPSMGILDNWLPVLHAARASHPEWRIVALIPDRDILAQLDPEDTAHVLADEVIDATIAPLVGGGWIEVPGLLAATAAAAPRRVMTRLPTRAQQASRTTIRQLSGGRSRLLYDVHVHEKDRLDALLTELGATPRFSHHHGIELESDAASRGVPQDPGNVHGILTYAESEIEAYANGFAVERSRIRAVGVLRHDDHWVERIVDRSSAMHQLPFERFAFVVSRPSGSPYLPRERKVDALRVIHRVAWQEHGLPLVLRLHPKELDEGVVAEALPAADRDVAWALSRAHPFHLAQRSAIGITFLSGVGVDLVALGVPVLQFLDIRGLSPAEVPPSAWDADGQPMFGPYARDGLVHHAHDIAGVRRFVELALTDRESVLAPLRTRLDGLVAPTVPAQDIVAWITDASLTGER